MLIPIVNDNDEVIGMKERDLFGPGDICRVSALWLTNSKGEVLIARRSLLKKHGPGLWSCAVAGTVDGEETYEENMVRETLEEIGLALEQSELSIGPKVRRPHIFLQWYFAAKDVAVKDLVLQEEEVMEARWISMEDLRTWARDRPEEFVESMRELMEELA